MPQSRISLTDQVQISRQTIADADTIISARYGSIAVTSLTSTRTLTLPSAASYPKDLPLFITDESGNCSASTKVIIVRTGSDTILGATQINLTRAYQRIILFSDGSSKWSVHGTPDEVISSLVNSGPLATALSNKLSNNGDSSSTQLALFSSGTTRSLAAHLQSGPVNAQSFGATGNGSTDDTNALQAAINYCVSNNRSLFIPSTTAFYKLTAPLTAQGSLSIFGETQRTTEIRMTANLSVISVTLSNPSWTQFFIMRDLLITTTNNGTATIAISVKATAGAQDRSSQNCTIERVCVRGATNPGVDGFNIGMLFDGVNSLTVRSCVVIGKINVGTNNSYNSSYGFLYNNDSGASPHPTTFLLEDCKVYYCFYGFYGNDFEGGLISNCQFVGIGTGFAVSGQPPNNGTPQNYPHFAVVNSHMNCTTRVGLVNTMAEIIIFGCLLYTQNLTNTGVGLEFAAQAISFHVFGNTFENYDSNYACNLIIVSNGSYGKIGPNFYRRANSIGNGVSGSAVLLTSNASNCKVDMAGSMVMDCANRCVDQGTSNIVVDGVISATATSETLSSGLIIKTATVVVNTDGGGNAAIGFPVNFPNTLLYVIPSNGDSEANGDAVITIYSLYGYRTYAFAIQARRPSGVVANTTLRVNFIAVGR